MFAGRNKGDRLKDPFGFQLTVVYISCLLANVLTVEFQLQSWWNTIAPRP